MAIILSPPPKFSIAGKDNATAAGWKIYTYAPGTLVNKATYTDSTGSVANTNPVILDSRGEADIWWDGSYKVIIKDENDVTISTTDNFTAQQEASQWATSVSSTYVNATSFTVSGNLTANYEVGRRILLNDATTLYGTITSSSYSSPNTTVNITTDIGSLSSSLISSQLSIITFSNYAVPSMSVVYRGAATGAADVITATLGLTALTDGTVVFLKAKLANATTTPTFNPDGLGAKTIVKNGSQALSAGDIARVDHELILRYNATNTEWELLNPNIADASITAAKLNADVPFRKDFKSLEQTITVGGTLQLTHGLSNTPTLTTTAIICKTAELGYSVGDTVGVTGVTAAANPRGVSHWEDATNINLVYSSGNPVFSLPNASTGALTDITNANWKLIVRAWA